MRWGKEGGWATFNLASYKFPFPKAYEIIWCKIHVIINPLLFVLLQQEQEKPVHNWACNTEFHTREEVEKAMEVNFINLREKGDIEL